jgi:hypothetical protein
LGGVNDSSRTQLTSEPYSSKPPGANNMRAWRTDATYPVPGAPRALRIHSGFARLWNSSSMAATFLSAYARLQAAYPRGPTFVVGHSMGGALAHLAALDLRAAFDPEDLRTYTFGSPRVGNSVFSDFFDAHVAQSWRFTHNRDVVPSLPPSVLGFHHTAREVWLVDVEAGILRGAGALGGDGGVLDGGGSSSSSSGGGSSGAGRTLAASATTSASSSSNDVIPPVVERVIVCDESGEDPSCHASVCHLGLCTSVADHYVYFEADMFASPGDC